MSACVRYFEGGEDDHRRQQCNAGITSIVWATGFRYDFDWLKLPIFDDTGEPIHRRGVTSFPGSYFLGLRWLYKRKSFFLIMAGPAEDATYLAEHIKSRENRIDDPQPRNFGEEIKMSIAANKTTVRRYFEEALDKRNLDVLDEIVTPACIIHRPEASEPIRGLEAFKQALERILQTYSEFTTTIHDLIAEEDRVACRLSHRAVNRNEWTSRLGRHAVAGKTVSWPAIAIFRIRDGKIAEEWVNRDELGMLIELGLVKRSGVN